MIHCVFVNDLSFTLMGEKINRVAVTGCFVCFFLGNSILLVCRTSVMIKRDSWGHPYCVARGEILGFTQDERVRKHLPRMFSLIKNES